jgi:hypothetical protein
VICLSGDAPISSNPIQNPKSKISWSLFTARKRDTLNEVAIKKRVVVVTKTKIDPCFYSPLCKGE